MIRYVLLVLALAGGYYYLSRHCDMDRGLEYIAAHKTASWAPRAHYTVARITFEREQYPKAQALFTQHLADYATGQLTSQVLCYLEDSAEYNHDWPAAKAAIDRYIDEYPEGPKADLMKKRQELIRYEHGL